MFAHLIFEYKLRINFFGKHVKSALRLHQLGQAIAMLLHERLQLLLPASRVFFNIPVHEGHQVVAKVDGFDLVRIDQSGLADFLQEGIFLGALAEAA